MLIPKKQAIIIIVLLGIELARLDQAILLLVPPRKYRPIQRGRCTDEDEVPDSEPMPKIEAGPVSVQLCTNDCSETLCIYVPVNVSRRTHCRSWHSHFQH